MTAVLCPDCRKPLDQAAVLCRASSCTDCERRRMLLVLDPWAFFVQVLRAKVRPDNTVHQADVRPVLRGRIKPQQISSFWRQAQSRSVALIRQTDAVDRSDDVQGRNAGRPEPVYVATERLLRGAA